MDQDGTVTGWNPTFGAVMLDLGLGLGLGVGLGVELCWPRSPEQNGREPGCWVKGSVFKQRRFVDDDDLRRRLAERHHEVNTQRSSRAARVVASVRLAEEVK